MKTQDSGKLPKHLRRRSVLRQQFLNAWRDANMQRPPEEDDPSLADFIRQEQSRRQKK